MQTGTKKTPDRFQNYFCPAAANDIVHHAYAWIVKEPNMQPKFLYCRAIDDPANDRGRNIIAEVWERDVLGGWGISSSTIHPEFEDTADGYVLAEGMPGTAASLPYQVFREVVNEHDTNYLIALAIAIDALPKDSTCDMDSRYMSGHTVDTGHAFIVSPGTYEPYIGIHDPVYGAGYMMVDLDKPFEIPMNRIWIAMDDYSGPETKEGLRGMYHSPQDVSAFSDPFCGSVSVTPTRDEKQEPAKSGLEAKRDACAISAAHLDSPNTEIPNGKNMERE